MNEKSINWLLFFINPFISMILSFINYTKPYAKNIFWAFCIFYGFTFAIGKESTGSDINRYIEQLHFFYENYDFTISELIVFFKESGEIDVFNLIITYFLSKFTNTQEVLTMVYAIFFGFFYSRNIWYVLGFLEGKLDILLKILLVALVLIVPIWYINGIRMYLAFHVFFYGLLSFIIENKKSKLFFLYISFLIHFSYLIPIIIFLMYRAFGNRLNIYFFIFIISLFVSQLNINALNSNLEKFVPQRINERTEAYRAESSIEAKNIKRNSNNKRWYLKWHGIAIRWSLYIVLTYLYLFGNQLIKKSLVWQKLLSFSLIFFSLSNVLMNLPSGGRFFVFAYFLILILGIKYLYENYQDLKFRNLITFLTPAFLLFIIVSIRMGFYTFSLTTLIGNPLIAILSTGNNISLNDLIK